MTFYISFVVAMSKLPNTAFFVLANIRLLRALCLNYSLDQYVMYIPVALESYFLGLQCLVKVVKIT